MECKPWEMDEGMSLIMMRMRRSLRTVLREAVLEEGLTPNEIEVLLFLEHGTYNTARDISRLRGMPPKNCLLGSNHLLKLKLLQPLLQQ